MQGQDDDARAPLGRALAAARQERGRSVDEVAASINLRATVVRAIERDDFQLCGGDVYARGHIRAYARHVGLAEGPLLDAYAERTGAGAPARQRAGAATTEPEADLGAGPTTSAPVPPLGPRRWGGGDVPLERSRPNWALVAGAALAVVLVLLVVQLVSDLSGPGRGTSEVASPQAPSTATPVPGEPSSGSPTPSDTATQTPAPTATSAPSTAPAGVAVALRATGDSWVSVRDASGRTMFTGLLSKGDARRFSDGHGLRLTLGNAGAVQLTVNGKALGSAGGRGQVVRLHFGPGDPA